MTAVRNRSWRSLAFVTALATVFALALPFGLQVANASHGADNSHDLDVTPEVGSNPTGSTHTLIATVSNDLCTADVCEIDFEVESGPAVTFAATSTSSNTNASDDGNTPNSPDATCIASNATNPPETGVGINECSVTFTSATAGTNVIRAWVDDDQDNTTADADLTEGPNGGGAADTGATGTAAPGDRTEVDDTDVVTKTWFTSLPALARLDCSPETATNPATGEGSAETYTCTLFNDNGSGANNDNGVQDSGESALAGFKIDGENCGGSLTNDNDPDNTGCNPNAVNTADYNDAGTTNASGQATITIPASEAQTSTSGGTPICFWVDADSNTTFSDDGDSDDGGDCDAETQASDVPANGGDAQITDVVTKTWVGRGVPFTIDLTPASDQNLKGESHTVTATVRDAFGDPVAGVFVDFNIEGRNDGADPNANQQLTGAGGSVTFTYTDVNTGTPNGEQDTITAYVDNNADNTADTNSASNPMTDTAVKFWFTAAPTSSTVEMDMEPAGGPNECPDTQAAGAAEEKTALPNFVGSVHTVCASAYAADGTDILGEEVTFTLSGPGYFVLDDGDGVWEADSDDNLGTSLTVATDAQGDALVQFVSLTTGNTTVTATADGQSDTGVKPWRADTARNISCDPATASNPPGTQHVITCTVTDRHGNGTNDVDGDGLYGEAVGAGGDHVVISETGAGRLEIPAGGGGIVPQADGTFEVVTSTTPNESGTQQITAELNTDVGEDPETPATIDDACDQAQGSTDNSEIGGPDTALPASEAPAGNCETTVEKVWEEQVEPQCSDGIDNDGDGLADDQDGGCYDENGNYDADDNDETNVTETTVHARTVEITKFKHIDLPGKKKPALMVKGQVTVDDGFTECNNFAPVKIQLRASGEWITRKTDFTNENGVFKVLIRHVQGKYRAVATRFELFDQFGNVDVCQRAEDRAKHKH